MIKNVEIVPLPLLKDVSGKLHQCIKIIIIVDAHVHVKYSLIVLSGSEEREFCLGVMESGENRREIFLPETKSEEREEFVLIGHDEKIVKNVLRKPVRKWTIYLLLHSHTDLGFTAPVSDVAQIHNDNTDASVLYCKETEHWPEGSRFKWTCEVTWQLQNYIRDRSPKQVESLMEQIRKKNIDVGAFYSGELTELLGHEQAARTFYFAAGLRRKYNIDIDTAMLCDVPGCTKGFVQLMAKSGIKNFILADNNFIAPFLSRTDLPRPFYWKGYDNTKILSWYTDHPFYAYIEGQNYGLSDSYLEVRKKLPKKLIELEKKDYPYSELQLQYAFDNFRIEFRPAAIVREWNEKWAYPKIKLAGAGEFLNKIREKYDNKIPELDGDWTNWWSGIVTGFPFEASKSRELHNNIPALEIFSSIAAIHNSDSNFSAEKIEKLYENILAFDEHSGTGMVWEPKSEEQQSRALKEGYGFIQNVIVESEIFEKNITENLIGLIENKSDTEKLSVFNFETHERDGEVNFPFQTNGDFSLKDSYSGELISYDYSNSNLKFYSVGVPPLGYKLYEIIPGDKILNQTKANGNEDENYFSLENIHILIKVEKKSGKIVSIFNKKISEELTAEEINFPIIYQPEPIKQIEMGKYIPEIYNGEEVPGSEQNLIDLAQIKVESVNDNLYGKAISIKYYLADKNFLHQKIFIINDTLRFENIINGKLLGDRKFVENYLRTKGILYFKFSFKLPEAQFRYEAPCSVLEPIKDQFKGSCKDYYAVQNWIQLSNKKTAINFSSIDAPLIDPGDIALMKYRNNFPNNPETLFVRAVSFSEVSGKTKSPYTNSPDLKFRFALTSSSASEKFIQEEKLPSLLPSIRLGAESNKKLFGCIVPANNAGVFSGDKTSIISISPDHIQLMTFKQAENGNGFILRLREIIGISRTAEIIFNHKKLKKIFSTQITEEDIAELKHINDKITLTLEPFSIQTIRVIFE